MTIFASRTSKWIFLVPLAELATEQIGQVSRQRQPIWMAHIHAICHFSPCTQFFSITQFLDQFLSMLNKSGLNDLDCDRQQSASSCSSSSKSISMDSISLNQQTTTFRNPNTFSRSDNSKGMYAWIYDMLHQA